MKIKRFVAPTMPQVLDEVRKTFGREAVIISNRRLSKDEGEGVEIVAALDYDEKLVLDEIAAVMPKLSAAEKKKRLAHKLSHPSRHSVDLAATYNKVSEAVNTQPQEVHPKDLNTPASDYSLQRRFKVLGIKPDLIKQLSSGVDTQSDELIWEQTLSRLASVIQTESMGLVERGGVYAFVGDSSAGKTAVLAKLAAQYAFCYGANGVGLISTASSHEQLQRYGKNIGVSVKEAGDVKALKQALQSFDACKLVLIDTQSWVKGCPQNFSNSDIQKQVPGCEFYMVMSAAGQPWVMKETFEQFKALSLKGVVLTKLDEAISLGESMSLLVEKHLPLAYMTAGQCVPEDICRGDPYYLINMALKMAERQSYHIGDDHMARIFSKSPFESVGSL